MLRQPQNGISFTYILFRKRNKYFFIYIIAKLVFTKKE